METNEIPNLLRPHLMPELAKYHQQLTNKYSEPQKVIIPTNPYTHSLMPFNGYYTLDNCPGAFFAVDTNMVVCANSPEPLYELTFAISLDGKDAARFPFTGTFDGAHLRQTSIGGLKLNLSFTRNEEVPGRVAGCSGSITLPGHHHRAVMVSGFTYNNPIPASLFIGDYCPKEGAIQAKVMSIGNNNQLLYDYGSNNGVLKPVPTYAYNLNMYYFSFAYEKNEVHLIMGTAGAGGLACHDMGVDSSGKVISRSLRTIINPDAAKKRTHNPESNMLASFSGYYPLPSIATLAFFSIQAEYAIMDKIPVYSVAISVSLDGVTSKRYYFDGDEMTFRDNTLNMPEQGITLKLIRGYDRADGSLVSLIGTINYTYISGSTLFNPVPLSVFGGAVMKNDKGDLLTVNNDNSVTYNGKKMDNIIYVPLMYILAYPADKPTTVMSFGTDGTRGNACIVTQDQTITSVYAIPTGK